MKIEPYANSIRGLVMREDSRSNSRDRGAGTSAPGRGRATTDRQRALRASGRRDGGGPLPVLRNGGALGLDLRGPRPDRAFARLVFRWERSDGLFLQDRLCGFRLRRGDDRRRANFLALALQLDQKAIRDLDLGDGTRSAPGRFEIAGHAVLCPGIELAVQASLEAPGAGAVRVCAP